MKKLIPILLIAALSLTACDNSNQNVERIQPHASFESLTEYSAADRSAPNTSVRGVLITVRHDGHLFIVEGGSNKGAIIHHPDCPCQHPTKIGEFK